MTKTCPDCQATVLSTSQPDRMGTPELRISIYLVEGDEQFIHFAAYGEIIARVPATSQKGIALLKLNAALAATPALNDDNLVSRLEDHGLFSQQERNALFGEARAEIVRLRAAATPAVAQLTPDIAGLADWLSHYATCIVDDERCGRKMLEIVSYIRAATPAVGGEALKPFIGWANAILKEFPDHDDDIIVASNGGTEAAVTFGDLRRLVAQSPPEQPAALRCDRCGSSGDVFMMCAGCQSPLTANAKVTAHAALMECASRCRYDGDLFHNQGNEPRRDAAWRAAEMAEAALSTMRDDT